MNVPVPTTQTLQDLRRHLAVKLADAFVNPTYMADLWGVSFKRFEAVLVAELCCNVQPVRGGHRHFCRGGAGTSRRCDPG